ncbi:hypothetical protein D3C81_246850 [compost metagenome]|uniref:hypothetical protein n=1 Tax=unclassified Janthinobacterium TaxID=2610881 RepID=UPI000CB06D60|nr:hypothetical protein [Janthinobacterium sp. AD80]PMQ16242.1 hypothetical protein JaAD80_11600 [Janthinobacterium sp. AD80]
MKNNIEQHTDQLNGDNVRTDKATAELVERGVAFHHTLGRTVATAYLREHAVPSDVIYRVFSGSQARRPARPARRRWR